MPAVYVYGSVVVLAAVFAWLNYISGIMGQRWNKDGSPCSWPMVVLLIVPGITFAAQAYTSRFIKLGPLTGFVDGFMIVLTVVFASRLLEQKLVAGHYLGIGIIIIGICVLGFYSEE